MSTGILVRQRFQPAKTQRLCRTSLTGPSAAGSAAFGLHNNRTTAVDVKVMATVVKVGVGGTEVIGDSFYASAHVTAKNVAGVASAVTNRAGAAWVDADASMADVGLTITAGSSALSIAYANGAGISAATIVEYQIETTEWVSK